MADHSASPGCKQTRVPAVLDVPAVPAVCREGPGINYMFLIVNGALLLAVVSEAPCATAQHSEEGGCCSAGSAASAGPAGCLAFGGLCRLPGQLGSPIHMRQSLLPAVFALPCCRWRHPCWMSACHTTRPLWLAPLGWACDAPPNCTLPACRLAKQYTTPPPHRSRPPTTRSHLQRILKPVMLHPLHPPFMHLTKPRGPARTHPRFSCQSPPACFWSQFHSSMLRQCGATLELITAFPDCVHPQCLPIFPSTQFCFPEKPSQTFHFPSIKCCLPGPPGPAYC
jgi:hypothetical protein